MALLTKEERRTLNAEQRKALRQQRRAEKQAEHKRITLDLKALKRRAAELVLDYAGEMIPGPERMDEVLEQLVEEADTFLVWSWVGPAGILLEAADGPLLGALVRVAIEPHVHKVYERLRDAGVLEDT